MRRISGVSLAAAVIALMPVGRSLQAQGGMEATQTVAGGGISVPGWMGMVDPSEAKRGMKVDGAKFVTMGPGMHVTTGPAITYWNPANKGSGDYTVKATFNEANYMGLNDHPHPYGIMIAGNDLGTDKPDMLYCEAYGDGHFIFRGFSSTAQRGTFMMDGRDGTVNAAVNKAEGKGKPVKQSVAMSVKGDKVTCNINGTDVASYDKSAIIGDGKLKTLDGMVGIRFAHNTDAHVSGFALTKP